MNILFHIGFLTILIGILYTLYRFDSYNYAIESNNFEEERILFTKDVNDDITIIIKPSTNTNEPSYKQICKQIKSNRGRNIVQINKIL